jgi:hypothetical protein
MGNHARPECDSFQLFDGEHQGRKDKSGLKQVPDACFAFDRGAQRLQRLDIAIEGPS